MKILKFAFVLYILLCTVVLSACGSSSSNQLTTVGNPKGAKVELAISTDVGTSSSSLSSVTIFSDSDCRTGTGDCYTPDSYTFSVTELALLLCSDSQGTEIDCPGESGEEIESNLDTNAGESLTEEHFFNETQPEDFDLYLAESVDEDIATQFIGDVDFDDVDTPGYYTGFGVALEMVRTLFPMDNSSLSLGSSEDYVYVTYCMNATNGCGSLGSDVLGGDLIFILSDTSQDSLTNYYWDLDSQDFQAVSLGRPSNPLTQTLPDTFPVNQEGTLDYHAAFGDGLNLDITQTMIDNEETVDLEIQFGVDNAMSFTDSNENGQIDASEMSTFQFGKPRITCVSTDSSC